MLELLYIKDVLGGSSIALFGVASPKSVMVCLCARAHKDRTLLKSPIIPTSVAGFSLTFPCCPFGRAAGVASRGSRYMRDQATERTK